MLHAVGFQTMTASQALVEPRDDDWLDHLTSSNHPTAAGHEQTLAAS